MDETYWAENGTWYAKWSMATTAAAIPSLAQLRTVCWARDRTLSIGGARLSRACSAEDNYNESE